MTVILICGALAGLGVAMLLGRLPGGGNGGTSAAVALAELDARRHRWRRERDRGFDRGVDRGLDRGFDRARNGGSTWPDRLGHRVQDALDATGVRLPAQVLRDLDLVGRSREAHLATSVLAGAAGFAVPLVLLGLGALALPALGGGVPFWVAVTVGLVAAGIPTLAVTSTAAGRRRAFRHVIGSFLDLVSMNLSGGRGIPEALRSAASISDGWAMVRIRDTLERARLRGVTPWVALGELGSDTGVDELRDLAAALALVADDGAKIRRSLAARATSLRRRELADTEGRAQARSQSMLVAQLLLAVGFLIFLIYPAVARVLGS